MASLTGSKTKDVESLASLQGIINFLTKEKKMIASLGNGWFKSSLKVILPWMRQFVSVVAAIIFDRFGFKILVD